MNKLIGIFSMMIFMLSLQCNAFAQGGGNVGGGGRAVVCRDTKGKIISAEMLDLYEAKTMHGLQLLPPLGSDDAEFKRAVYDLIIFFRPMWAKDIDPKTGKHTYGIVFGKIETNIYDYWIKGAFFSKITWVISPAKLQLIPDSYEVILPGENCAAEQLAYYYEEEKIFVQKEIWDALDSKSRAALLIHEIYYQWRRQGMMDHDSRYTRRIVGHLFSTSPLPSPYGTLLATTGELNTFECGGSLGSSDQERFSLRLSENKNQYNKIQFWRAGDSHGLASLATAQDSLRSVTKLIEYIKGNIKDPQTLKINANDGFRDEFNFEIKLLPTEESYPYLNNKMIEITRIYPDGRKYSQIIGCGDVGLIY